MLEESTEYSHSETEHTSYFGAKSFKQFDTGSADNRRRKHLTIVLHKDIMRKSGLYSRESRKTLRKSLDKLWARFNNRCRRLLHRVSPPGLLLGDSQRGVLLNLLLNLPPGWGCARYPHRAWNRSEVTQEFAVQLLKYALICFRSWWVWGQGVPAACQGCAEVPEQDCSSPSTPEPAGDAQLRSQA